MMIPWQLGMVLFVILGLITGRIAAGSLQKHTGTKIEYFFGPKYAATAVITSLVLIVSAAFGLLTGRAYVVSQNGDCHLYYTLGTPSRTLTTGQTVSADSPCVINDTDDRLLLEEIIYDVSSEEKDEPRLITIEPGSCTTMQAPLIRYFLNDRPPPMIRVKYGRAVHWWLHRP